MKNFLVTGKTEEEINKKIEEILIKYPRAGYGTFISPPYFSKAANEWQANGQREESAD